MTIDNQTNRNQYTANGSNTAFGYGFKINADTELTVIVTDSAGADTSQVLTTDYTVDGIGNGDGGNVNFVTAPTNTYLVTIIRNVPLTQATDFVTNDAFPAAASEDGHDKQTMIAQRQQEELDRTIKVRPSTDDSLSWDGEVNLTDAGEKYLRVKSDLSGIELVEGTTASTTGIGSVDGVTNAGGDVNFIASTNMTITPDNSAKTITFAAASAGIDSLNSVTNAGGNVDVVGGTAITVTPDDGNDQITVAFNASGVTDNSISGDKIDGGTISNFTSSGINDDATSEALKVSDTVVTIFKDQRIESTAPRNTFIDTDGATDEQNLRFNHDGGSFKIRNLNDAKSSGSTFFQMDRTGTVADLITLTATTTALSSDVTISGTIDCTGTESLKLPVGTTAQRPSSPSNGDTRHNSDTNVMESYINGSWETITTSAVAGETNTATALTSGAGTEGNVFKQKTGVDFEFRAIKQGTNITITENANDITIDAAGSVGEANTASNVGAGTGNVYKQKTGVDLELKTITGSGGVTITDNTSTIDISLSSGSDVVNVKTEGALADNSTDDATAFGSAITAAQAITGGGVVYVPAGTYRINSTITKTLTKPLRIRGDGADTTTIRFTGGTHGFDIDGGTISGTGVDDNFIVLEGVTLMTAQAGAGSALQVNWTGGSGGIDRILQMKNVIMRGETHNTHYWSKGLDAFNARNALISDCHIQSKRGDTIGVGFFFDGDVSGSPVDNILDGCSAYWCDKAVEVDNTFEGLLIDQCFFINCTYGVYWNTTGDEPLLSVQGSHMNCYNWCIYGFNVIQCLISKNLLYQPTASNENWVGIELDGTSATSTDSDIQIKDNILEWFSGSGSKNGIVVDARGKGYIAGNTIKDMDTGVWLQSNSQNIKVIDNDFNNCSTNILDAGTNNITRLITSTTDFRGAMVYRTSAQSISNASWTIASWNATDYDTSSIVSGNKLKVPSGVTRVRVKCQVIWAGSATGGMRATIIKNGQSFATGTYVGQPHVGIAANQVGPSINMESPVLTVVANDEFEVQVRQDTGGSLDIAPTNTKNANICWFAMEIIE
jgi:hypothetical protein